MQASIFSHNDPCDFICAATSGTILASAGKFMVPPKWNRSHSCVQKSNYPAHVRLHLSKYNVIRSLMINYVTVIITF